VWYFVVPEFIRNELKTKKIHLSFEGSSIQDNDGKIGEENIKIIEQYYPKDKFKPAHLIDPFKKIELMAEAMNYVDSSISCTYNLPETASIDLIEQLYVKAWEAGIKSVAVYRDKTRQGIIEFESPILVENRFKEKKLSTSKRPDKVIINHAPRRPKTVPCDIHTTQIKGEKWTVLIGKLEEYPFEMFAGKQTVSLPDKGTITKIKSKVYILECEGKEPINILDTYGEHGSYVYSKMLSHGVPLFSILDWIDKMIENVLGFNKAMGRILKKYMNVDEVKYMKCSSCGSMDIIFQEGCILCRSCNASKCS